MPNHAYLVANLLPGMQKIAYTGVLCTHHMLGGKFKVLLVLLQ